MLIVAGIVIILVLIGSSAKNLFSASIKDMDCIVEPSDGIPR